MKITKKLLILALALIALTLAMSISIFAEESTEPTVYEFNSMNSFKTAYASAQAGDIIRMTADTEVSQLNANGDGKTYISKAVIIDLNGKTLTTTSGYSGILIGGGASMINGTILHKGNTSVFKAANLDRLENLTLIVQSQKENTGGISMRNIGGDTGYAHINTIKNVKMIGTGNYGIETYGQGDGVDKTKPVIDLMEECEIDSITYALDLSCSIGTIKNCVLSGSKAGISCKSSNSFVIALNLVGDNEIMGGNSAVLLQSGTATIVADKYTDFVNVNGGTVFSGTASNYDLDVVGYSVVNGAITECAHNVVGGSCTERSACSVCGKVFDYIHSWIEDETKRVPANCTVQGKAYFDCECGATKEEFIARDPDAHEWVATVTNPTHTTEGFTTYNCKYGSCVGEEYTANKVPVIPHEYTSTETEATCEEDGKIVYTCSCGHSYEETIDALGHNYEASGEVDGKTVYTCTNCGDSYTCNHNYVLDEKVDATCTTAGYTKYKCSLCEGIKTDVIDAKGHEYHWNFLAADGETYIHGCPVCKTPAERVGNESTNLGYKILYVSAWNELKNAIGDKNNEQKCDIVRLTADVIGDTKYVDKEIIIDLGGHTVEATGATPLYTYRAKGIVNGKIYKSAGGLQGLVLCNVDFCEDITIDISLSIDDSKGATGLFLPGPKTSEKGDCTNTYRTGYVGILRNITITGAQNHAIEAASSNTVIDKMINVHAYANGHDTKGQGFSNNAQIGEIVGCTFSGRNVGLYIQTLQGEINLQNCEIYGGILAICVNGASATAENKALLKFDAETSIVSDGAAFYVVKSVKEDVNCDTTALDGAVALVNGQLYTDLDAAVAALNTSDKEITTFTLINNLKVKGPIVINKKVNFSLGGGTFKVPQYGSNTTTDVPAPGYTITAIEDTFGDGVFHVIKGGVLTLSGDGIVNSVGNNNYNIAIWADGGEVIINGGTYTNIGKGLTEDHYDLIYVKNSGSVVINGGTFIAQTPKWTLNLHDTTEGSIVVNGGNFYTYNPAASETEPNGIANFVAEGKCVIFVEEGNLAGYYVVGEHVWTDATCTTPKTCSTCGTTDGAPLGHSMNGWTLVDGTNVIVNECARCDYEETNEIEASVNGEFYETFEKAYASLKDGDVIKLYVDLSFTDILVINKKITLDGNGKTITSTAGRAINIDGAKDVTIKNVTIVASGERGINVINGSTNVSIDNATVTAANYAVNVAGSAAGADITINGCTLTGLNVVNVAAANVEVTVKGGKLTCNDATDVENYAALALATNATNSVITAKGVEFDIKGDSCEASNGTNTGKIVIDGSEEGANLAYIEYSNGTAYTFSSIEAAIAKAQAGETIVLLAPVTITKDTVLDFSGITIKSEGDAFIVTNGATLTINGNGTVNAGTAGVGSWCAVWANGGHVVINGGSYSVGGDTDAKDPTHQNDLIYTKNGGTVTIYGGTFVAGEGIWTLNENDANRGTIKVYGGNFGSWNPANNVSEGANTNFVANGYHSILTDDKYVVSAHTAGEAVVENETDASCSANGSYDTVVYCEVCDAELSRTTTTTDKLAHTEVEIPAVLPTPSTTGYTAGIKCSECGAIIKAPVEIKVTQTDIVDQFRIDAISLEAKENIAVNYKTYAKAGYNNPYIVFVFNGNEYMMLEPTKIDGDGRLVFKFDQTFPQLMQDNIEAYFYAETAVGEYAMDSVQEYSVLTYILKQLKKNDAALTTVMSDILYMGAKTQIFMNYKTDALVTDLAAAQGYTLTPTAFTEIPSSANITKVTGDRTTGTDWYSTSLAMGASTEAILKFQTDDASNLKIKIAFEGKIYTYNASELKTEVTEDGLVYLIYFDQVKSFEYDKVITATFERDGEQVGSTITYSINSFLARNYNKSSQPANAKELMKALYTYGVSSAAYFG